VTGSSGEMRGTGGEQRECVLVEIFGE